MATREVLKISHHIYPLKVALAQPTLENEDNPPPSFEYNGINQGNVFDIGPLTKALELIWHL